MHRNFDETGADFVKNPIGTGPFELVSYEVGQTGRLQAPRERQVVGRRGLSRRRRVHRLRHRSVGRWSAPSRPAKSTPTTRPSADYVDDPRRVGAGQVGSRHRGDASCARTNVANKPYDDQKVRHALQLAVDNAVVLQLGYGNAGDGGGKPPRLRRSIRNMSSCRRSRATSAKAKALMTEAGQADFEHELITVDEDWHKNTGDAIAAQIREAGIKVKRTVLPGSTFWNDWTKYPYSMTNWNMRPLGVQVLALAYRTGEAWNEAAYSNPEFDAKLGEALSHRRRREAQGGHEGYRDRSSRIPASSSSPTGASSTTTRCRP